MRWAYGQNLIGSQFYLALTFHTSFPHSVGVFETWNDVILDLESEHQAVTTTLFQSKPQTLGISSFWYCKNNVRSISSLNCKAKDLHTWLQTFWIIHGTYNKLGHEKVHREMISRVQVTGQGRIESYTDSIVSWISQNEIMFCIFPIQILSLTSI